MIPISKFPIKGNITNEDSLNDEFNFFGYSLNYYLNKSILEGDYIKNNTFSNIDEITDTLQELTFDLTQSLEPNCNPALVIEFAYIFDYQLNTYTLFYEKTKRLYSKENLEFIDKSIYIDEQNKYFKDFQYFIQLLKYNIELAKIDHSFLNDETILKQLFYLKNGINNIRILVPRIKGYEPHCKVLKTNFDSLISALKLKCEFLIDKWYARSKSKLSDNNLKHKDIFASNQYINYEDNKQLTNFKNKIIYLYDIRGYETSLILKSCFQEINRKNLRKEEVLNNLNVFELHTLIKYYKDEIKCTKSLKSLIPIFDKKTSQDNNNLYENFALHISKQYCQNNYFSLLCDELKSKTKNISTDRLLEKLEEFQTEYKEIQNNTTHLTDNFFLQYKFLKFSLEILDNHIESSEEKLEAVKKTKKFHQQIEQTIEEFEQKTQWSLKNNNYIFKLPYNESLIEFKNLKIYLSSSFLLPIIEEDILKEKRLINTQNQKLKLIYNTEQQIKEINLLQEEYKADNKRIIEVVTLFTAVISFIVGSVGGFKFMTDIYTAISFVAVFALCLLCFVLTIMRFLKKDGIGSFWDFGFLLILLAFIAIISLNMQNTLKPASNKDNNKTYTIQLKPD